MSGMSSSLQAFLVVALVLLLAVGAKLSGGPSRPSMPGFKQLEAPVIVAKPKVEPIVVVAPASAAAEDEWGNTAAAPPGQASGGAEKASGKATDERGSSPTTASETATPVPIGDTSSDNVEDWR